MPSVVIRFINNSGFVGKSIDWATNSLWCHVEIEVAGKGWLGARAGSGVQIRPYNYASPSRERRYSLEVSEENYQKAMTWGQTQIGTKYNYADILGLLFKNRHLNSPARLICSEFGIKFCRQAGLYMLNVLPGWDYLVTPEILHLSPLLMDHCVYSQGC